MKVRQLSLISLCILLAAACQKPKEWPIIPTDPVEEQKPDTPTEPDTPDTPDDNPTYVIDPEGKYGISYLYGGEYLPEIHITLPDEQMKELLAAYDKDNNTKQNVHCDIRYVCGEDVFDISDASIRLKGNTSRRRPMDGSGKWHHTHWQINFHKFVKDDDHKIHGAKKVVLKWFNNDPSYVREHFCFDLFRRAGVWTGMNTAYVRVYAKLSSDSKETYLGIYDMMEPLDDEYLKARKDLFGSSKGYLWKCRYGADLRDKGKSIGADLDDGKEYVYELKTSTDKFDTGKMLLLDLIDHLNSLSGAALVKWAETHCDLKMLMRTYAVNVAVGMWDDYWNNCNNYYLYFTGSTPDDYRFWFIPYDYDNTLGTSSQCGVQSDAGRQNPLKWGDTSKYPLIGKLIEDDDCRQLYCDELLRLVDSSNGLIDSASAAERIVAWQGFVKDFVKNDTGEDMVIEDRPASWGNHSEYRLLGSKDNFFTIKAETIRKYCK